MRRDRPAGRDVRPHRGQVPVPARRRLRDAGALVPEALPPRVRGARSGSACPSPTSGPFGALYPELKRTLPLVPRLMATTETDHRHRHVRRPRGAGARGHAARRRGRARRGRDPGVLLRAAARAAGRRLPHVPGRGRDGRPADAEAAGRLHDDRRRRHGRAQRRHLREGRGGPGRGPRVPAPQPPARLPGLRQGRRVPAAGPRVPLRPRQEPDDAAEAHVREAAADLALDRARPRALHPLLPLHALLVRRRRGRRADRARARRPERDRDVPGAPLRGRASAATSPSCARSARCCRRRTGSRRGRGRSSTCRPSARAVPPAATPGRRCARAAPSASCRATTPRSTTAGSATAAASRATSRSPTASREPLAARGERASAEVAWDDATRTIAQRLRHVDALHGAGLRRDRRRRRPHQRGGLRLGPHRARAAARGRPPGPSRPRAPGSCSTRTRRGSTTSTAPT